MPGAPWAGCIVLADQTLTLFVSPRVFSRPGQPPCTETSHERFSVQNPRHWKPGTLQVSAEAMWNRNLKELPAQASRLRQEDAGPGVSGSGGVGEQKSGWKGSAVCALLKRGVGRRSPSSTAFGREASSTRQTFHKGARLRSVLFGLTLWTQLMTVGPFLWGLGKRAHRGGGRAWHDQSASMKTEHTAQH